MLKKELLNKYHFTNWPTTGQNKALKRGNQNTEGGHKSNPSPAA
jgi:hypothetical protein